MKFKPCELNEIIPKELLDKFFEENDEASAEMDCTFMGFEEVYKAVTLFVPKNRIIIDLGCAYALQSWYFKDYKKYIGVDTWNLRHPLLTDNSEYYFRTSIQDFINNILPKMNISLGNVYAICSYVLDEEAMELVKKTFPHCLTYYPNSLDVRNDI